MIFELDSFPSEAELAPLFEAAWGSPVRAGYAAILQRSLCHGCVWDGGPRRRLIGFVNVAWDGGVHAFLLDTMVARAEQRQGHAARMVKLAVERAKASGCEWLHVDFEPHLRDFYFKACGFKLCDAGLIALK